MLADLGAATRVKRGQALREALGTMSYAAPEVLSGSVESGVECSKYKCSKYKCSK